MLPDVMEGGKRVGHEKFRNSMPRDHLYAATDDITGSNIAVIAISRWSGLREDHPRKLTV